MSDDKNQGELDPNETPVELSSDEIKADIIEKYGIDESENGELLEKLVADKIDDNKKFSTVIRQKIDWRTKAEGLTTPAIPAEPAIPAVPAEPVTPPAQPVNVDDFIKKIDEKFEQRDLDSTDLSDELKTKVKSYAKNENVSVKVALESDYIQYIKMSEDNAALADGASLEGKGKKVSKKDYTADQKFEGDMSTPEGKEEFKKRI